MVAINGNNANNDPKKRVKSLNDSGGVIRAGRGVR